MPERIGVVSTVHVGAIEKEGSRMGSRTIALANILGLIILTLCALAPLGHSGEESASTSFVYPAPSSEFDSVTVLREGTLFGGSGHQRGTALSGYNASDLFVAGVDEAASGGQALALHYLLNQEGSPTLDWVVRWPGSPNQSGNVNSEVFDGVVATRGGTYFAGRSWSQTDDGVGDKEHKSVLVKFPFTGATGAATGGAEWVAKPIFFTYRGNESFLAVTFGADRGGAAHYVYAAGYGQANGINNTAVLAQYDGAGTLRWSRVLGNTGWFMSSFGSAVTTLNGYVYVAGMTHYPYTDATAMRITLWKYDDAGNLIWTKSAPGTSFIPGWRGAMALTATRRYQSTAGDLYVAGTVKYPNSHDVVVLKYDEGGNLLWRTTWGREGDDIAHTITANDHARTPPEGQRLYVMGKTNSSQAESSGWDMFMLEVDPATGGERQMIGGSFYRGDRDNIVWGIQRVGSNVYAVGETKSFAGGGNQWGENEVMLLRYRLGRISAPVVLTVPIDIRPGSTDNPLNPGSHGRIPVAILSSSRFQAPEMVKQESLTFGRVGTERSLASCSAEDVNGDALADLVCHFETQQAAFQAGDAEGILKGLTVSGQALRGADSIRIVPGARP